MNRKYTKERLEDAAKHSISIAGMMRYMGVTISGGLYTHLGNLIKNFDIDTSHFTGQAHNKGKVANNRKSPDVILVLDESLEMRTKTPKLKRCMLEVGCLHQCGECGMGGWYNGKPLVLHIDHIDGNWKDNRVENLRFLCPNCHSQTDTYCRKKGD